MIFAGRRDWVVETRVVDVLARDQIRVSETYLCTALLPPSPRGDIR